MPDTNAEASTAQAMMQEIKAANETPSKAEVGQGEKTPPVPSENPLADVEAPETETKTTESEKLYAGKYKSPEELEKAYLSAEQKMHSATEEASDSKKLVAELYGEPEKEIPLEVPDVDNMSEEEAQNYLQKMVDTKIEEKMKTVINPYIADLEVERVKAKNPDLPQLIPSIKKVYEEFPELRRPGQLERAVRLAKADFTPELVSQAKNEGAKQAVEKIEEAKTTQTEKSSTSSSREDKLSLSPESIQRMSAKELREILP